MSWRRGRVRARAVLLLTENGDKVIGPRFVRLLHLIDEQGSLRGAARELGLGYRHALAWVQRAEALLERALVERRAGGAAGGGAVLTPHGRAVIDAYETAATEIAGVLARAERTFFPRRASD
ncbi:MAG TPA: LysR family transcriptional regulator [Gemmatimonadaceae bacterium]|nr:LysR family transcriptional regulator [Gemmatimonadaceae bacterium]